MAGTPQAVRLNLRFDFGAATDLHGEVYEVAQELALQAGRGQFLDVTFCLLVRYSIGFVLLVRPLFLFLSPSSGYLLSVTIVLSSSVGVTCLYVW